MDEIGTIRQHEALVAIRLYSLLDNLINALIPPETEVVPGGYSEEMFDEAWNEEEKSDLECSICYNLLKDCRQCEHGHKFCAPCIIVWSMQPADFSDKCPVCRCTGDYATNNDINCKLNKRRVHCTKEDCNWRGYLGQFEAHKHKQYSEADLVEIEKNGPSGNPSNEHPSDQPDATSSAAPPTPTARVPAPPAAATPQAAQDAVLPAINDRAQQAPSYASRPSSSAGRSTPSRLPPEPPRQPQPPSSSTTPRPPAAPRPQQQRASPVRRRSCTNVASEAPTPTPPANPSNSRLPSARQALLPPLADAAQPQPQPPPPPTQTRTPAAPAPRRPLPAPQASSRPVAPTQPAVLHGAVQSDTPQPHSRANSTAPTTRPSSRASSTASFASDTTRTSTASVETSRSNLREVRNRLLASRQQVATILGIIAYEMEGRRRMQEYAMFEHEFSRRNHQLGREMDVLRNQLHTVSQVLETMPQQQPGRASLTGSAHSSVFGAEFAAVADSDSSDDDTLDFAASERELANTVRHPAAAQAARNTNAAQPSAPSTTGPSSEHAGSSNPANSNS